MKIPPFFVLSKFLSSPITDELACEEEKHKLGIDTYRKTLVLDVAIGDRIFAEQILSWKNMN